MAATLVYVDKPPWYQSNLAAGLIATVAGGFILWLLTWLYGQVAVLPLPLPLPLLALIALGLAAIAASFISRTWRSAIWIGPMRRLLKLDVGLARRPRVSAVDAGRERSRRLQIQKKVFVSDGLITTLRTLYPRFELLTYGGSEFPIWTKLAAVADRDNLDAALGRLSPGPDPRRPGYPSDFDPAGERVYLERLATQDGKTSFNGATFALDRIEMDHDRLLVHAKHGTYFHSLATSECLEAELVAQLARNPGREVPLERLPRRKWLHEAVGGEHVVLDGRNRGAALSVAATLLISQPDGTYQALLARRSHRVATHASFWHVAPSGIFAPLDAEHRDDSREFSVRSSILREYAEELFSYLDLEDGKGSDASKLVSLRPIKALKKAQQEGRVSLHYCGISVPLLTLRPELSVLIFVRDPLWFDQEIRRADQTHRWFSMNWEYESGKDRDALMLALDADFNPIDRSIVSPAAMLPHAAAALHLSTTVAGDVLRLP